MEMRRVNLELSPTESCLLTKATGPVELTRAALAARASGASQNAKKKRLYGRLSPPNPKCPPPYSAISCIFWGSKNATPRARCFARYIAASAFAINCSPLAP